MTRMTMMCMATAAVMLSACNPKGEKEVTKVIVFSWVFALKQTPFFIQEFVRRPRPDEPIVNGLN